MNMSKNEFFPDDTKIDSWFYDATVPELDSLGKKYIITDYGVVNDGKIYTEKLQSLIDLVAEEGGGVVVVPPGVFHTGALFFKQGVNLYLARGAVLFGSDDPLDYPLVTTRMEGQTCKYFPALINVDSVDGFTMCGEGTIDGNGFKAWKRFWTRREWNPDCTNKDEQRPRLVYISNSTNVTVTELQLQNSHYWTVHIYKCQYVRFINCSLYAAEGSPSTDGIDIDVCSHVLVKGCRMEVCDDCIALKGGKGPWADTDPDNGTNEKIIVEDCEIYRPTHAGLTCGSEAVHNKNIIFRRIKVDAVHMFRLKMRPDTPQLYEHILVEDIDGKVSSFLHVHPYTQFFDLKGREDVPLSYADSITIRNCNVECKRFLDVLPQDDQYVLSNFSLEHVNVKTIKPGLDVSDNKAFALNDVNVEIIN